MIKNYNIGDNYLEIAKWDGPHMRPFIKFLRKSYLGLLLIGPALKVVEYLGNGVHPKGRHGTRFNWSAYGKLIMVGQSHLDAAWRWITKQGNLKSPRHF